ncbi:MAG: FAD-linked oxidase C-terminal domain-containing protein [Bacteroidota bacterium]
MNQTLAHLKTYFEGELFFDDLHKMLYATDASVYRKLPLAVAYPKSVEGIRQLITFANDHGTSLIPRTAGTSLAGQCVGEGIVVDVSKHFTKIVSVDTEKRTVTVQPGVIRDELNDFLRPYGLFFGPNTSTSSRCMIGGMVGNNSSGTTSIQYGVTRDKVVSIRTLLSDGSEVVFSEISSESFRQKMADPGMEGRIYSTLYELLSPSEVKEAIEAEFPKPEIHRRNTGYAIDSLTNSEIFGREEAPINIGKLLCGSEGTLAFTTEVTLQLDDLPPPFTAMVVTQYASLRSSMLDVGVAMKHNLHTCELIDATILERTRENTLYEPYRFFVQDSPEAVLLLELKDTTEAGLQQQVEALLKDLEHSAHSYARPVLRGEQIDKALALRKAGLGLLGNMVGDHKAVACIEDTAVALEDLPAYIADFENILHRYDQKAVYYAHAGAGELHLRPILNLKTKEGVTLFREITTEVAKLTKQYKGSFSGEHGDGIVRAEFLELQVGKKLFQVMRKIKEAFDPKGIFNPGKITDAWPMDQSLRYEQTGGTPKVATLTDFDDSEGILSLAEKCNGSGDCRKTEMAAGAMCPSYHATRNEKDTTRARANVLREVLTNSTKENKFDSKALKEALSLCLSCKACASECPSNVDMTLMKSEFLYQYKKVHGSSRADRWFARSTSLYKKASRFPGLANRFNQGKWSSGWVKRLMGIAPNRSLPSISSKSFSKRIQKFIYQHNSSSYDVWLFVDEFSNYLEANIAEDAYQLLTGLGYQVGIVDHLDSCRALLSKGFLKEARNSIDENVAFLKDKVSGEVPLVGIEPSAVLGFRDEFPRLASDKSSVRHIAQNTYLIEEFLALEMQREQIGAAQFTSEEKQIKIHVHCHQKALSNQKITFDLLNLPANYRPTLITSGCCGMAGSFGYEASKYDLSMSIGELRLFPAIRKASEKILIAANGTSCRHQIKDGTGREALHPITILRRALR